MNREMAWSWGQLAMRRLENALGWELELLFCDDGTVIARYPGERNERFWFDPRDGFLHQMVTIIQHLWSTPTDRVKRVVQRLNRRLPPMGYFTVEPGWGITYRSSVSMLPIAEPFVLDYWYSLCHKLLDDYKEILTQIPQNDSACRLLDEKTRYLDRMPAASVYPCGSRYKSMNRAYEMMTKGVY